MRRGLGVVRFAPRSMVVVLHGRAWHRQPWRWRWQVIGEVGRGFEYTMYNFNHERWGMAGAGNRMRLPGFLPKTLRFRNKQA